MPATSEQRVERKQALVEEIVCLLNGPFEYEALGRARDAALEFIGACGFDPVADRAGVYFIQIGDDGPVKVGQSHNVPRRLEYLQNASPLPLVLLMVNPVEDRSLRRYVERLYHRALAPFRLRGEWFAPAPEVLRMAGVVDG